MSERLGPLITVDRVGRDRRVFKMYKFSSGNNQNVDELAQIFNILRGDMNAIGHRPISPAEFEEFLDSLDADQRNEYLTTVVPTMPGIFSSFALKVHSGSRSTFEERWAMDVSDVQGGSAAKRRIAREAIVLGFGHYLPLTVRSAMPRQ